MILRFLACLILSPLFFTAAAFAESSGGLVTVGLQRHSAGTFYVAGALEGYGTINFLVDTGSSYLVINETVLAVLKKAGKVSPGRELDGVMADGSRRIIPTYRLAGLRLGKSCWIDEVEAAVISGNTRPILGMEVLSRLAPFTFSADPAHLVLARCQSAPAAKKKAPKTRTRTAATGAAP